MKLIDKPGVYPDLSIDDYHGQCCIGPSISASGITQLLACPAKFWAFSPLNPHAFAREPSSAMNLGKAAHSLALGEPEFNKHFIVSPYDDFRSKEARAWRDSQSLTVLKADDFETVKIMAAAIRHSHQTANALEGCRPEVSLIYLDGETGIWIKSRPDLLPNDPATNFIREYKTCATIEPYRLSNNVFSFGYHIQAAMQIDAVRATMNVEPLGIAHICQEKEPPYLAELRMFTPEQIEIGRKFYRKGLRLFAECLRTGMWPGYTRDPSFFQTPYRIAMEAEGIDDEYASQDTGSNGKRYSAEEYLAAG